MSRKELEAMVDFILNRAGDDEFEVIVKACERRQRDRAVFSKLGGLNPNAAAGKLAGQIQEQMGASMEGLRKEIKEFVAGIIRKNAPELSDAQLAELLDAYVPEPGTARKRAAEKPSLPPEALIGMVRDFVDYSEGRMPPSRQEELWSMMRNWQDEYWRAMPPELRSFVKAYLEGRIGLEEFWRAVYSVLGV